MFWYQVFMVPPPNQSGTTIAHNPDGSVSQLTVNGVDMPLVPGTKIGSSPLVPIVAASSGSAVVHSVPNRTATEDAAKDSGLQAESAEIQLNI